MADTASDNLAHRLAALEARVEQLTETVIQLKVELSDMQHRLAGLPADWRQSVAWRLDGGDRAS